MPFISNGLEKRFIKQHGNHFSIAFLSWRILSEKVIQALAKVLPASGLAVFMAVTFSLIFNEFLLLLTHNLYFSLAGSHFVFGSYTWYYKRALRYAKLGILSPKWWGLLPGHLGAMWLAVSSSSPEQGVVSPGKGWSIPEGYRGIRSSMVLDRIHLWLHSEVALLISHIIIWLHDEVSGPASFYTVAARSSSGLSSATAFLVGLPSIVTDLKTVLCCAR